MRTRFWVNDQSAIQPMPCCIATALILLPPELTELFALSDPQMSVREKREAGDSCETDTRTEAREFLFLRVEVAANSLSESFVANRRGC